MASFYSCYIPRILLVLVIILFQICWAISLVCMECYSGKIFVSVEGFLSGFIVVGWNILSPMGLRCDDYIYEKTSILLVSMG